MGALAFIGACYHVVKHLQEKEEHQEAEQRHGRPVGSYKVTDIWVEPSKDEKHAGESFKLVRPSTPETVGRNLARKEAKKEKSEGMRALAVEAQLQAKQAPVQLPEIPKTTALRIWDEEAMAVESSSSATGLFALDDDEGHIGLQPALPPPILGPPLGATSFDEKLSDHVEIEVRTQLACRPPAISRLAREARASGMNFPTRHLFDGNKTCAT